MPLSDRIPNPRFSDCWPAATPKSPDARAIALQLACLVVPVTDGKAGQFLSTARVFERYISSGTSQSGQGTPRVDINVEGLHVVVEGEKATPELADSVRALVDEALA